MARQTREERRARRVQTGDAAVPPARARPAANGREGDAGRRPPAPPPATTGRRFPGSGGKRFVTESWGELKKVEWPGQNQVIQGTVVVLIACLIVGFYLYASDEVFKRLVEKVFLR